MCGHVGRDSSDPKGQGQLLTSRERALEWRDIPEPHQPNAVVTVTLSSSGRGQEQHKVSSPAPSLLLPPRLSQLKQQRATGSWSGKSCAMAPSVGLSRASISFLEAPLPSTVQPSPDGQGRVLWQAKLSQCSGMVTALQVSHWGILS